MSIFHGPTDGHTVILGTHTAGGGTTNFNFTHPLEYDRPVRPREPFSTVPFAPDPDFVDRPAILAWVRSKCAGPGARAALVGLGGVGKSQLAIQYAHSVRDATPRPFVFWVHASSKARFEEAYRDIANRLELPGRHDPKTDVLRLVSDWLRDETNGQWTMIVDNADDIETFFPSRQPGQESSGASLAAYLPQSRNGSMLITSRSKDAAARLVGGYNNVKEVLAMEGSQGLQLLRNKLQVPQNDENAALDLVRTLNYMPLAITQAAAYINRRARITIANYLNEFLINDKKRESLLHYDAGDLRRDESASNSVVTTWQMSFERIRHERRSAAELLSLMSFFNSQGIPEQILRRQCRRWAERSERTKADSEFEKDLDLLQEYCLVSVTAEAGMCEMHPLVQFCTRVWLTTFSKPKQWDTIFLGLMDREFPRPAFGNWTKCQQLLPHIDSLYKTELYDVESVEKWTEVLTNAARYMHTALGKYEEAEKLFRRALQGRENGLGHEHLNTLTSVSNLALMLGAQGKHEEAEPLNRRALQGFEKKLGHEHLHTLTSVSNLAGIMLSQGKRDEAETLNYRVLQGREKKLGYKHPDTLLGVSNLAIVLRDQGKYNESETLNRRALQGREKELGYGHPDTLKSVSSLAIVLQYQGKWDEAETLYRRALQGNEKELGHEHPETLMSVKDLALLLDELRRYEEARELYQRACDSFERQLGLHHPKTIACREDCLAMQEEAEQARLEQGKPSTLNNKVLVKDLTRPRNEIRVYDGRERQHGRQHSKTVARRENSSHTQQSAEQARLEQGKTSALNNNALARDFTRPRHEPRSESSVRNKQVSLYARLKTRIRGQDSYSGDYL